MPLSIITADQRYSQLITTLTSHLGVKVADVRKRGLKSSALCINDKIFAALASSDQLVIKLPRGRVDALVAAGLGVRFEPFHGAALHEWFVVGPGQEQDWLSLAEEALSITRQGEAEHSSAAPP